MRAIGLSGFAGSGKTAAAMYLERYYGFKRRHVANTLREMLLVLLKRSGVAPDMVERYLVGDLKEEFIPEVGCTSRELQISLGTAWGREMVNPDIWVNTWMGEIKPGESVLNDGVRFPNEEDAIYTMDGFTIMIHRPGFGPVKFKWGKLGRSLYRATGLMWGVHDSERIDRLCPRYRILNDGSIVQLYAALDHVMALEGVRPINYA